jgi:hypothetical protein
LLVIVAVCALFSLVVASASHAQGKRLAFQPFNAHHRIHPDCLHGVPSGSHIDNLGKKRGLNIQKPDGTVEFIPPCKHGFLPERKSLIDGSGWQVYAYYNGSDKLNTYTGDWVVPPPPSQVSTQILYTFTGLQNSFSDADGDVDIDIIQPVLQFGTTPAGGGNYWALASWYVSQDGAAIFSQVLQVNSGDSLTGIMQESTLGHWFISSNDTTSGGSTYISVSKPNTKFEPWAFVTLEVYQVTDCSQYPTGATIPYTNLMIMSAKGKESPTWQTGANQKICKESISIISPSSVTISF